VLGGLWGGISRVNWLPVAGMLAAGLYLIEHRAAGMPVWRYLVVPVGWFLGGALAGLSSQFTYAALSGNDPAYFTTSFTSDLLWDRLWPNPNFPLGILLASLLASSPLIFLIVERLTRSEIRWHPVRLLGWAGILLVFFGGGLVVSVKIGGGNDLHNLDAYLFFLLVLASGVGKNARPMQTEKKGPASTPVTLMVCCRAAVTLYVGTRCDDRQAGPNPAQTAMSRIQTYVDAARQSEGEVLFISERHLLTFSMTEGCAVDPRIRTDLLDGDGDGRQHDLLAAFLR
jgi:hypothetical protein